MIARIALAIVLLLAVAGLGPASVAAHSLDCALDPTACLEHPPHAGDWRWFDIEEVWIEGQPLTVSGKLYLSPVELRADFGCALLGGPAYFAEETLELGGPVGRLTERPDCPLPAAAADAAFLAAINGGPFDWDGAAFRSPWAMLVGAEMVADPMGPPAPDIATDAPEDGAQPVDRPVAHVDLEACRAVIGAERWDRLFGPPTVERPARPAGSVDEQACRDLIEQLGGDPSPVPAAGPAAAARVWLVGGVLLALAAAIAGFTFLRRRRG